MCRKRRPNNPIIEKLFTWCLTCAETNKMCKVQAQTYKLYRSAYTVALRTHSFFHANFLKNRMKVKNVNAHFIKSQIHKKLLTKLKYKYLLLFVVICLNVKYFTGRPMQAECFPSLLVYL